MYIAGLPQISWALPSVQAALGKAPPSVVFHGVGVRPGGVQLRYAQHRHVHAPVVGGQGANIRRRLASHMPLSADVTAASP